MKYFSFKNFICKTSAENEEFVTGDIMLYKKRKWRKFRRDIAITCKIKDVIAMDDEDLYNITKHNK